MQHSNQWIVVVLIIAGLQLSACERKSATNSKIEPAHVEHIQGTELSRVRLTKRAAERVDIKTTPVREAQVERSGSGMYRQVVPYSAVLYDEYGVTWVYTTPEPLVFVRHRIIVDYIVGDQVVLSEGPPTGTEVVTVGAAELFGTEFGIGH